MLHIATRPEGQHISTLNFKNPSVNAVEKLNLESPMAIGLNSSIENEETVLNLAHWLSDSELIGELKYVVERAAGTTSHRVILKFKLSEKYASWFVTLRALFSFGRPSFLSVSPDRSDQSFSVSIVLNDVRGTIDYFETIGTWLTKEIRFKEALKEVIRWEARKKEEELASYKNLYASLNR